MEKDPVCGMTVDPATAAGHYDYLGRKFHFCSKHCLHSFSADPAKYVSGKAKPVEPVREGVQYS